MRSTKLNTKQRPESFELNRCGRWALAFFFSAKSSACKKVFETALWSSSGRHIVNRIRLDVSPTTVSHFMCEVTTLETECAETCVKCDGLTLPSLEPRSRYKCFLYSGHKSIYRPILDAAFHVMSIKSMCILKKKSVNS